MAMSSMSMWRLSCTATDLIFKRGPGLIEEAVKKWYARGYQLAAVVFTDDLDNAFHLTNHVTCDWTENSNVFASSGPQRSTSVGDIVMDADGKMHVCLPFGWQQIEIDFNWGK